MTARARATVFSAPRSTSSIETASRAVSVDAIAAEAGTTKVTFYRVFESKDDLDRQGARGTVEVVSGRWWDGISRGASRRAAQADRDAHRARISSEIIGDDACRGCAVANAAVEIVDEDHPARAVIQEAQGRDRAALRDLCAGDGGAKQPDVLGDALSLLYSGAFSARSRTTAARQIGPCRRQPPRCSTRRRSAHRSASTLPASATALRVYSEACS